MRGMDTDRTAEVIDEIVEKQRARDQMDAQLSGLMVEFVDLRTQADREARAGRPAKPGGARPGEFAADEVAMAIAQSVYRVRNTAAMTRRVKARLPLVWATWCDGDVDAYKVSKIDQAMRCLSYDASILKLDRRVVEVAGDKTPKQLQTWLNRFVAHTEPDRMEQRHRRAFSERSVFCFQELDGMGWISGAGTAVDTAAIDAALTARARAMGADDPRSMDQRRADLYIDALKRQFFGGTDGRKHDGANTTPNPNTVQLDHYRFFR